MKRCNAPTLLRLLMALPLIVATCVLQEQLPGDSCPTSQAAPSERLLHEALLHSNLTLLPAHQCSRSISRRLTVTGFHAKLEYQVRPRDSCNLHDGTPDAEQPSAQGLVVIQRLPPGIYADPYELGTLAQEPEVRSHRVQIRFHGQVDLESMGSTATPQALTLMLPADVKACAADDLGDHTATLSSGIAIRVPLHSRYVQAVEACNQTGLWASRFVSHTLDGPLAACYTSRAEGIVPPSLADALVGAGSEVLQWTVPAGSLHHASLVAVLTVGSSAVGAMAVLWHLFAWTGRSPIIA